MGRKRIEGRRPGLLTRIFHTRRSRRREEADGPNGGTSPPPHVGGYGMWAFHATYEISRLRPSAVKTARGMGKSQASSLCGWPGFSNVPRHSLGESLERGGSIDRAQLHLDQAIALGVLFGRHEGRIEVSLGFDDESTACAKQIGHPVDAHAPDVVVRTVLHRPFGPVTAVVRTD